MAPICAVCGIQGFKNFAEYSEHKNTIHGGLRIIQPERRTNRSKAEIVKQAEASWLKPFIIESGFNNATEHLKACRCPECFDKYLNKVLAWSNKITFDKPN
jgi:hypothetical protein